MSSRINEKQMLTCEGTNRSQKRYVCGVNQPLKLSDGILLNWKSTRVMASLYGLLKMVNGIGSNALCMNTIAEAIPDVCVSYG